MIKIYGMRSCPDCSYLFDQIDEKAEFQYIDIGDHILNMKEFLKLRDHEPVFDACKENGAAGVPCFLFEDGHVSLTPEDAGLKSRPVSA